MPTIFIQGTYADETRLKNLILQMFGAGTSSIVVSATFLYLKERANEHSGKGGIGCVQFLGRCLRCVRPFFLFFYLFFLVKKKKKCLNADLQ